jgi:formylglycine-generating enzyme required for sulfatase activity
MNWRLRILVACLTGVLCASGADAAQRQKQTTQSESRVALLIGNARYPDATAPLHQVARSVRELAEELRRNGFDVSVKEDLGKDELQRALDEFKDKVQPNSTALVFFGGFALQSERQNFLVPINAQIWSESDVRRDGIGIEAMLSEIHGRGAAVKLLILDASRRTPYERRFRRAPAGLAPIAAPVGTLIISAGPPGKVVNDDGKGSIFVGELVKEMRSPGQSADKIFSRTRIGVARATKGEQVPWVSSTLLAEYYLRAPPEGTASAGDSRPPRSDSSLPGRQARRPDQGKPAPPRRRTEATAQPADPVRSRPRPGDAFRDCGECPELAVVPAGTFDMGSNDSPYEKPVHRVRIPRPFAIGRRETTFAEWDRCVAAGECLHRPDDRGQGRGDRPVTDVSWTDAKAYVQWLSRQTGQTYRLPSEAEWEYAARAGTKTAYWWGRDIGRKFANCRDCGGEASPQTMEAATFFPNSFGLFDSAGNAAEWVEDCWNDSYRKAPRDGSAWTTGECARRVLRGGSFDSQARYLRSASRFRYDADVRYYANGFRVVRELP